MDSGPGRKGDRAHMATDSRALPGRLSSSDSPQFWLITSSRRRSRAGRDHLQSGWRQCFRARMLCTFVATLAAVGADIASPLVRKYLASISGVLLQIVTVASPQSPVVPVNGRLVPVNGRRTGVAGQWSWIPLTGGPDQRHSPSRPRRVQVPHSAQTSLYYPLVGPRPDSVQNILPGGVTTPPGPATSTDSVGSTLADSARRGSLPPRRW